MQSPYSRKSKVRSTSRTDGALSHEYNRVGLALAIFAALCFFLVLWGLNGYFTARTIVSLGLHFQIALFSWGMGWLIHIIVSLIENHLWKLRGAVGGAPGFVLFGVYGLIVLVGTIDVLTSSLAFLQLFASFDLSPTDPTIRTISIVLAEVIAIVPEPVIVWLAVVLWRIIQDEEDSDE